MRTNEVLLVYPRVGAEARGVSLHPPLPLLYLAAYLSDYRVSIFDERVDEPEKYAALLARKPICVGFSIFTGYQIGYALKLAQQAKDAGLTTVFGGVHATILPEQTQADPRVDHVVAGDGEIVFRNLVESLAMGKPVPPVLYPQEQATLDLDAIPRLPYELVDIENYVKVAATPGRTLPFLFSRGCPFSCTFCCNPVMSRCRWRAMSVPAAESHLNDMVARYRLDSIFFTDENLTVNPKVLNDLASRIGGRFQWYAQARANSLLAYDLARLEKMGAQRFGCGLESGSDRILKLIKKGETVEEYIEVNRRLAKTGIRVSYNYITGYPSETPEDLRATIDLALRMIDENPLADNNTFYLLTPYPGAEISRGLEAEMPQSLEGWSEFGRHNYNARWHDPAAMRVYQRIGFSSKFVGRRLARMFPDEKPLADLSARMMGKWRQFDFADSPAWDALAAEGWQMLRRLFGANAY